MPASFQKPDGISYVSVKDISQSDRSTNSQSNPPEFWSAERIRTLELDSVQCLKVAAEAILLSELPPAAAYAAITGGHQCFVNLTGDFFASDKDNADLHKVTNIFDPLGLQFAILGGIVGGQNGLVAGAELGAAINGGVEFMQASRLSEAYAYLTAVKLSDDFKTFFEDATKLFDEWQMRFGDQQSAQDSDQYQGNDTDQSSDLDQAPDQGPDTGNNDSGETPSPTPDGENACFMG